MRSIYALIQLSILTVAPLLYAQPNGTMYFPLQTGNVFVYEYTGYQSGIGPQSGLTSGYVFRDTVIFGKTYYAINGFPPPFNYGDTILIRVDPVTGSIYKFDMYNLCSHYHYEEIIDSLSSIIGDTLSNCASRIICVGEESIKVFGIQTLKKSYFYSASQSNFTTGRRREYVKNIGFYRIYSYAAGHGNSYNRTYTLKGCVINGVVYGDTTKSTTGINQISSNLPDEYSLFQNYPNPFNPSTKIKFDITNASFVKLTVYDILGREAAQLVNQNLGAGSYEYEFDGTGLNSGVYFYKLEAGELTETKRMVLLK